MKREELEAFAREAAKSLKSEKDLNDFSRMLSKITVEAPLILPGKNGHIAKRPI
jgi:putative transposase